MPGERERTKSAFLGILEKISTVTSIFFSTPFSSAGWLLDYSPEISVTSTYKASSLSVRVELNEAGVIPEVLATSAA